MTVHKASLCLQDFFPQGRAHTKLQPILPCHEMELH